MEQKCICSPMISKLASGTLAWNSRFELITSKFRIQELIRAVRLITLSFELFQEVAWRTNADDIVPFAFRKGYTRGSSPSDRGRHCV